MSQLISKTDYVSADGRIYETHVDMYVEPKQGRCYNILQSTNGLGPVSGSEETVCLTGDQAVAIAKTILRNEGYDID